MNIFKYLPIVIFLFISQIVQSQLPGEKPLLISKKHIFPYPIQSIHNKEQGVSTILLTIDAKGKVTSTEVVNSSGYPRLDKAAENGFRKCKFKPELKGGIAVEGKVEMKYTWIIGE